MIIKGNELILLCINKQKKCRCFGDRLGTHLGCWDILIVILR